MKAKRSAGRKQRESEEEEEKEKEEGMKSVHRWSRLFFSEASSKVPATFVSALLLVRLVDLAALFCNTGFFLLLTTNA